MKNNQVECYAFIIATDEALHRRHEIIHDVDKLKGFHGISPMVTGQLFIFDTEANRNEGFEIFKKIYKTVTKCPRTVLIDKKYLDPNHQSSYKDFEDQELNNVMSEIEELAIEKAKKEYIKREAEMMKVVNQTKTERDSLAKENESLRYQVKILKEKNALMEKAHSEKVQKITKELKSLEAEMKRMEKANMLGDEK